MPQFFSARRMFLVLLWATGLALTAPAQGPQTPSTSAAKGSDADGVKPFIAGTNGTTYPSCYYMPNPPYTEEARTAKFEGTVLAEGVVSLDETVTNLRILKSPGLGLSESVLKTLKTWKCKPATHEGKAVAARTYLLITFRLK